MGETSGSVIRALSLGKPLVVSDVGWFSELPDDVALKVPRRTSARWRRCTPRSSCSPRDDEARAAMAAAALELARREHDARPRRRPLRRRARAGGGRRGGRATRCSARSRGAAAEVGIEPGSPEATRARAAPRRGRAWVDRLCARVPAWALARGHRRRLDRRSAPGSAAGWSAPFILVDELIYSGDRAQPRRHGRGPRPRASRRRRTASSTRS